MNLSNPREGCIKIRLLLPIMNLIHRNTFFFVPLERKWCLGRFGGFLANPYADRYWFITFHQKVHRRRLLTLVKESKVPTVTQFLLLPTTNRYSSRPCLSFIQTCSLQWVSIKYLAEIQRHGTNKNKMRHD